MKRKCDQCELLRINGIVAHETGCPNAWKDQTKECKWCGSDFKPKEKHQDCCTKSCSKAYHS